MEKPQKTKSSERRSGNSASLSAFEQKLLCKKFDCEDGPLCRILLRVLKWRKPSDVTEFVSGLQTVQAEIQEQVCAKATDALNLWDGISRRISEERYVAGLLGKQSIDPSAIKGGLLSLVQSAAARMNLSPRTAGALASVFVIGIATTALLPYFGKEDAVPVRELANCVPPQILPDVKAVAFDEAPVSYRRELPVRSLTNQRVPQAVAIDWMRSKGSVRFMEDPQQRVSVLWVSPRSKDRSLLQQVSSSSGSSEMGAP